MNPTISTHLPDLVDSYIATRAQRLAKEKEAALIEEQEKDLQKLIIAKMRADGMTAMGAANGLVKLQTNIDPIAVDWRALWDYIKANDAFELLHKRVTVTAVKEHWENGEEIPGVGRTETYKLTVSKA
jgi:hypothetical protein